MKLCLMLLGIVFCSIACAQDQPPPKVDPAYELLYQAGELVKADQALDTAEATAATLTQKRMAISDKPVVQAFDLMHRWLDTPAAPTTPLDLDTPLPMLQGARALSRALVLKHYVLMADGRIPEAIETMRDGLRLAYALEDHSLIGWLVGRAINAMVARELTEHLDQLSAPDCDRLFRLAQAWAAAPDPLPTALEREREAEVAELRKSFDKDFRTLIQEGHTDSNGVMDADGVRMTAQADVFGTQSQEARKALLARVEAGIDATFRSAQLSLRTPYWEQPQPNEALDAAQPGADFGSQLTRLITPTLSVITDRYTQQQAAARLLGCHAALRRYKWENGRYPAALEQLKIGDMITDPFNGKPFDYKVSGAEYQLQSLGPLARDNNNQVVPGQHVPFTLTPGK